MDTVINDELADIIIKNGGIPIFHRFTSFEQQIKWSEKYNKNCFLSCGLNNVDGIVKLLEAGDEVLI